MRLLQEHAVERRASDPVFRQSSRRAVTALVTFAMAAGVLAMAINAGRLPPYLWGVVGFLGLALPLVFGQIRSARRPSNWIVTISDDTVFVKFRSHLNHHFDPDTPSIIALEEGEIAGARKHTVVHELKDGPGHEEHVFVELELRGLDTAPIAEAIDAERGRRGPKRGVLSWATRHCPITVPAPGVIRIGWRTRHDAVVPSIETLFSSLDASVLIGAPVETGRGGASGGDAMDDRIMQLVDSGQVIEAVKLLREEYGYGLTEAKAFVDGARDRAA